MTSTLLIQYGGWGMAAIVAFILYFFPARRKQLDEATAKLIKTLQDTLKVVEGDLKIYKEKTEKLETQQAENMGKIAGIEAEKQLLRDFIAGRDKKTEEFQTEAMKLHNQNSLKITELVDLLSKHFLNMERSALQK